jgi:hypothetical protein
LLNLCIASCGSIKMDAAFRHRLRILALQHVRTEPCGELSLDEAALSAIAKVLLPSVTHQALKAQVRSLSESLALFCTLFPKLEPNTPESGTCDISNRFKAHQRKF